MALSGLVGGLVVAGSPGGAREVSSWTRSLALRPTTWPCLTLPELYLIGFSVTSCGPGGSGRVMCVRSDEQAGGARVLGSEGQQPVQPGSPANVPVQAVLQYIGLQQTLELIFSRTTREEAVTPRPVMTGRQTRTHVVG